MPYKPYLSTSGLLRGFDSFLEGRNLDAKAVLAKARLNLNDLHHNGLPLPSQRIAQALELAAEIANDDKLGLKFAAVRDLPDAYGLIARLSRSCDTYREAIGTFIKYQHLIDQSANWRYEISGDKVFQFRRDLLATQAETTQLTLLEVGNAYRQYQRAFGRNWQAVSVSFSHNKPRDLHYYKYFFSVPVEFNCEYDGICYLQSILDTTVPQRDPDARKALTERAHELDAGIERDLRDVVKSLISVHLIEKDFSIGDIAVLLDMGPRTLLRKLNAKDTNFRMLVLETRIELAVTYLRNPNLPLADIANFIGYSEASAFTRAFRAFYGTTPSAWRDRHTSTAA